MLFADRVHCDFCGCRIGQLFNTSAQCNQLIHELSVPPYFALCPDCLVGSVVKPELLPKQSAALGA